MIQNDEEPPNGDDGERQPPPYKTSPLARQLSALRQLFARAKGYWPSKEQCEAHAIGKTMDSSRLESS